VWGSIARQLGGQRVAVRSLVSNPNTDPHEYEPTAADARWLASADLVVANGIGYDPWIDRLLAANGTGGRRVVHVGTLVGLKPGDNPHQWYSPGSVSRVITAISDAYKNLDPTHSSDYDEQRAAFETVALAPYRSVIHAIAAAYAGTPIGASESVFVPMAQALGLNVRTPESLLDAVSEGGEPTAADKTVVDRQIATRAIKVFVFNTQNATPDVQRLVAAARAAGVPVTAVTETLTPRGAAFQDWQTAQLQRLESALHAGTGA
jgi:zinc/manganese transport system substrate-binding protein